MSTGLGTAEIVTKSCEILTQMINVVLQKYSLRDLHTAYCCTQYRIPVPFISHSFSQDYL